MRLSVITSSILCIVVSAADLPPNDPLSDDWRTMPDTDAEDKTISRTIVQSAVCNAIPCAATTTFHIPNDALYTASLELSLHGDVRAAKDSLAITLNDSIIGSCSDCSAQCDDEQVERCLPVLDVTKEVMTGSLQVGFSTSSAVTAQLTATLKLITQDSPSRVLLATPVPTYVTPMPSTA